MTAQKLIKPKVFNGQELVRFKVHTERTFQKKVSMTRFSNYYKLFKPTSNYFAAFYNQ